ncbi:hypothetical protein PHLGIDRAFT_358088 [Phlebiopsis gigantea 11061_1 CR5-6]|uniref:BTB domain-containing protein n=1 Tax=Phlebiopsis gigantea (strain 11061_1 CR5-6) TaxID=745531 RepID=A0A0C3S1D3_PHLG1|nr:hypothetical protein PHLGIDRAFT_358088 [Phlebiopsis gigantea 11061_1 CR5-6]
MATNEVIRACSSRSEDVWFEDGTVVLQVENTLFRVYSGLLSRHSPFFKHLFTLPQPPDAECCDGCPLIKLVADDAEDVRDFLLAIHEIGIPNAIAGNAVRLSAVLQLSSKYEVAELHLKAVEILTPICPVTLSTYYALDAKLRAGESLSVECLLNTLPALIAVANAASTAAPHLLPFVLLQLIRTSDGDNDVIFGGVIHNNKCIMLKPHLQTSLMNGRSTLTRLARDIVYPSVFGHSCPEEGFFCDSLRIQVLSELYRWDGFLDPLRRQANIFAHFCGSCKNRIKADMFSGRAAVWSELPKAFGLSSWQELTPLDE